MGYSGESTSIRSDGFGDDGADRFGAAGDGTTDGGMDMDLGIRGRTAAVAASSAGLGLAAARGARRRLVEEDIAERGRGRVRAITGIGVKQPIPFLMAGSVTRSIPTGTVGDPGAATGLLD